MVEQMIDRLAGLAFPTKLSTPMIKRILDKAELIPYAAGSYLLKEEQVCRGAFFLASGLARSYYKVNGREITSRLMEEGFIITSWVSFYLQQPGIEFITAIENCNTVFLSYEHIQELYEEFPLFNQIGRKQVEYSFFQLELRTQVLQWRTAAERYQYFYEHYPSLLQRVPLKYIASYLGMSEVTLSRVRSEFHKKKKGRENGNGQCG
jgi:CRP/FNR family transcriptional regulator, anaerobic regulatory protein